LVLRRWSWHACPFVGMLSGLCKSCTYGRDARKRDYPANTEHNVTPRSRLRTKMVL